MDQQRLAPEGLLDTAAALFREKGYAATTTREIAAAAGMQQASLYYHVASKEGLLYQICVSALEDLLNHVRPAVNEICCPLERIQVLIHTHLVTLLRSRKRNVTMLSELHALSDRHRAEVLKLRHEYSNFVQSTLAEAQVAGALRADIPAKYLYLSLLNVLNWTVLWFRENRGLSGDQLAVIFARLYLYGAATSLGGVPFALPDLETQPKELGKRRRAARGDSRNSGAERVLEAATTLFSQKSYAGTSTREIAALIGIRKASLYYHIGSKEDLLYRICKSSLEQIRTDVERELQPLREPLDRARALVQAHVESMLRDQGKHLTTLTEMRALSEERLAEVMSLRDGYEDLVRRVLREGQAAGALRDDIDVKYLRLYLLGLLNRGVVWYRQNRDLSPVQFGGLLAILFLAGAAAKPGASKMATDEHG